MKKQRLGILGGMGPQATQVFYQRILARTDAAADQEHIPTLINSDSTIPDRTAAILGGDTEACFAKLLADARELEGCGCTVMALPCNTAHYFVDRLQGEIGVPIVHMVRETVGELHRAGRRRVGILATDGTVRTGIYQRECEALGMEAIAPDPEVQKLVMSLIYDEIKRGEQGSPEKFALIDRHMREKGCDCAVLACTELSVYRVNHNLSDSFYVDAMEVLTERCITRCGYPLRQA